MGTLVESTARHDPVEPMARILLIEDDLGAIAVLKRSLARAGFEVLVATNLPDALSATENERPEAVLVSAGLQGESASSLVEAIRSVDLIRPLVVLGDGTGTGEPSLPKPVDAAHLVEMLRELMPGGLSDAESPAESPANESPAESPDDESPDEAAVPAQVPDPWTEFEVEQPVAPQAPVVPLAGAVNLAHRRELAARALAEAQARRRAAEVARAKLVPETLIRPGTTVDAGHAGAKAEVASVLVPARSPTAPSPSRVAPSPSRVAPSPSRVAPSPSPPTSTPPTRALAEPLAEPFDEPFDEPLERRHPSDHAAAAGGGSRSLDAELFGDLSAEDAVRAAVQAATPLIPEGLPAGLLGNSKSASLRRDTSPRAPFPPLDLGIAVAGSLDKTEPAALLLACHRARLTGQLQLDQGPVQRVLYFADGRLSGAASTSTEERLESLSYRRGLITREQQRLLRAESKIPTRRLALLMVERSYLKPAELFPLVQERVEEVIYEACGAFAGSYALRPELVPDDERVALSRSPLALATEGLRRKYEMDRVLAGLGGPATLLRPAETRGPELSEYGLTARERRLAQSVDGLRNIEELLFESGSEPLPGLKVLYALLLGRSVEIAVRGLTSESTPALEAKIDLARVAEKHDQVRSANYFEVLGVSSSATPYEISQAYERLAREFQPGRFRDLRRPEVPAQLDEIQRVLAEARDILIDAGLRDEYRAHLRK